LNTEAAPDEELPRPHAPLNPGRQLSALLQTGRFRGHPLSNPAYVRLLASTLFAYAARFLDMTMLSWLVVQRTVDPLPVALLSFFRFVPFLAGGPLFGLLADRLPRLRLIRGAQTGLVVLALSMAGLLWTDSLQLWHIYVYALCQGALFILDSMSRRSYMAGTVGASHVTVALSVDMLGSTVTRIMFSNAAGALLDASSPRWGYLLLAAFPLMAIWMTRGLPTLFVQDSTREPFLTSVRGGLAFARANRLVLGGLLLVALSNLTGFVYEPMVAAVADEVYHATPILFGMFLSATGVGSLATTLWLILRSRRISQPGWIGLLAMAGMHLAQIGFSYSTTVVNALTALAACGAAGMLFSIAHSNLFLVATPDDLRGRVLGLQALMIGTFPLSNLLVGWLGNHVGPLVAVRYIALAGMVWVVALGVLVPELRQKVEDEST